MKKSLFLLAIAAVLNLCLISCGKENGTEDKTIFTITFDCQGGAPVPASQTIEKGGFVSEPSEEPTLDGQVFAGWYTQSGLKFNFTSTPVTKDIVLVAHYWQGPKKYIVINDYDWSYLEKAIYSHFGDSNGYDVAVGQGLLFYIFQRPLETHKETLKKHLQLSEQYNVPVLVQLDPITFWDGVPELWNWFDPAGQGYSDANRENVEWTSWSSADAVKLGWLNWGSQIRLKPMANLFSPAYQAAVKERMDAMISIVENWYNNLPAIKKHLLIGIKITGELGVGVNNWYYTNGNDLYGKSESNDPTSGINMNNKPSRSNGAVSAIGYAGCKYAGIKSSGLLTGDDIAELEHRFTLFVSELARKHSIPREKIFAHAGGVGNDLDACINDLVCPSWSFYGADASDGKNATYCLNLLKNSDAPNWGVAEWAISASASADTWAKSIRSSLSIDRCYFLSIYTNVIGNNNGTSVNTNAVQGILQIQQHDKY